MGRTSTGGHIIDVYTVTFQVAGGRHPAVIDIRMTAGDTTFADIPTVIAKAVHNTPDNIIVLSANRVGPTPEQAAEWRGFNLDAARETFEDAEVAQERLPFEDNFELWLRTWNPDTAACDECRAPISNTSPSEVSAEHAASCSLHPLSVTA